MFKTLALAALLGFAASTSVSAWSQTYTPVNQPNWLVFQLTPSFDFGYGTHWGVQSADAMTANSYPLFGYPNWYTEYYGVHLYSTAMLTLMVTVMNHRQIMGQYELWPVYVAPYRQYSGFARLENSADNHAFGWWVAGTYDIQILNFQTYWTENVLTDQTSVYDYITGARK